MDGYGTVMQSTTRRKGLSMNAKALYSYLCSFAGNDCECWPSRKLILSELECGKDRFYNALHELEDQGIVRIEQRRSGNKFSHNVYVLLDRNESECPYIPYPGNKDIETQNTYPGNRDTGNRDTKNNRYKNKQYLKETDINKTEVSVPEIKELTDSIVDIINSNKARERQKGRLKKENRMHMNIIAGLLKKGYTPDQLKKHANSYSDCMEWFEYKVTGKKRNPCYWSKP